MGLGGIVSSITGTLFGGGESPGFPELSQDEKDIIAEMKDIAVGDPELGELYLDFTKRALRGEIANPAVEQQLERDEAEVRERISRLQGAVGDIASTGGREAIARFQEGRAAVRGSELRKDVQLGEGLLSSRANRRIGAAGAALNPLARQREGEFQAAIGEQQRSDEARAGLFGTLAQAAGGAVVAGPGGAALAAGGLGGLIPQLKEKGLFD